ncbi:MAG: pyrroline-5-carboxylate reductase [Caryophanon sp.]|nr:pyrroline-5-carboxylate reductase [Caryophanon sp.]
MNYGFIGLGNMATAIIKGMCQSTMFAPATIFGLNRSSEKTNQLVEAYGISACFSTKEILAQADVIILAVKPHLLEGVLRDVAPFVREEHTFISIAAGKPLSFYEQFLPHNTVIRVMPNINAMVGASTSCFSAPARATDAQKQMVRTLFSTVGSIVELPEEQFAIFTATGCSSPAFTYMYIDAIARAGVRDGLPKKIALEIAASSVLGSAKMVLDSIGEQHPYDLVDQVCSPGGTTIEGVMTLQDQQFEHTIHEAIRAVMKKDATLQ